MPKIGWAGVFYPLPVLSVLWIGKRKKEEMKEIYSCDTIIPVIILTKAIELILNLAYLGGPGSAGV